MKVLFTVFLCIILDCSIYGYDIKSIFTLMTDLFVWNPLELSLIHI